MVQMAQMQKSSLFSPPLGVPAVEWSPLLPADFIAQQYQLSIIHYEHIFWLYRVAFCVCACVVLPFQSDPLDMPLSEQLSNGAFIWPFRLLPKSDRNSTERTPLSVSLHPNCPLLFHFRFISVLFIYFPFYFCANA